LPKNTTKCPRPGLEPGPLAPGTNERTDPLGIKQPSLKTAIIKKIIDVKKRIEPVYCLEHCIYNYLSFTAGAKFDKQNNQAQGGRGRGASWERKKGLGPSLRGKGKPPGEYKDEKWPQLIIISLNSVE